MVEGPDGELRLSWTGYDFEEGQEWSAVFGDPNTEMYSATSPDGFEWSSPDRLTTDREVDIVPHQVEEPGGSHLFFWTSSRTDPMGNILAVRPYSSQPGLFYQITHDRASDYSPKALLAADGTYWLTWVSSRDGTLNIWYALFDLPPGE
ncbi:MAG: hypothetical protein FVQ83_10730 [Chloroflexi bacterium]|nr:hypothetical protein [Chloroflexota bacterium]